MSIIITKKLGKIFSILAGVFTLVYILLIVATSFSRGISIIELTGLLAITLWLLVIIDIDTLLKKRLNK